MATIIHSYLLFICSFAQLDVLHNLNGRSSRAAAAAVSRVNKKYEKNEKKNGLSLKLFKILGYL